MDIDGRERNLAVAAGLRPFWGQPAQLGVLPGSHVKWFSRDDIGLLTRQMYLVSARSSRQGIRLEGQPLAKTDGFDVLSCGVCAGCVQLTNDGMPVILLAEHQTTGGYAVAVTVVSAHLPDAAQLRPGDQVRFTPMTQPEAALALTERMRLLTESFHAADAAD
jgi:allophanate hydrolase subunit 2